SVSDQDNLRQWNRFQTIYAWRIHRLIINDTKGFWSLLDTLASTGLWKGPLFPCLKVLDIRNTVSHLPEHLSLIVNPNVTKFVLHSPPLSNEEYLVDFVRQIPRLMRRLRHVEIHIAPPISPQLSEAFADMSRALGASLERLFIPTLLDQITAIAFHPNLKSLCQTLDLDTHGPTNDIPIHHTPVIPVLPSNTNSFPSLTQLSLMCSVVSVIQLLEQPGFPLRLTRLTIKSPSDTQSELPTAIRRLMTGVATKCAGIRYFSLEYSMDQTYHTEPSNGMITFDDLAPLSRCTEMRQFSIYTHLFPLSINDEEFASLVSAWPDLSALHLNPDPLVVCNEELWPRQRKALTWRSILSLARYVPAVKVVLLLLDPSGVPSLEEIECQAVIKGSRRPKLLNLSYLNAGFLYDPLSLHIEEKSERGVLLREFLRRMVPMSCLRDHRNVF
ncbi:hypothetical protein V5O48_006641, partial [Marasmius crinis-equi]